MLLLVACSFLRGCRVWHLIGRSQPPRGWFVDIAKEYIFRNIMELSTKQPLVMGLMQPSIDARIMFPAMNPVDPTIGEENESQRLQDRPTGQYGLGREVV